MATIDPAEIWARRNAPRKSLTDALEEKTEDARRNHFDPAALDVNAIWARWNSAGRNRAE
jgi:hypothetical protein